MSGLRVIFVKRSCYDKAPLLRCYLGNRVRLSQFVTNSSTGRLTSVNFSFAQYLRPASTYAGNEIYRFIKNKINNIKLFDRKKDLELGMYLYQSLEHVKYQEFYKHLNLPDTYRSWFVVTELHVWMILVRLQREGVDARIIKDSVVESFYEDSTQRAKILAPLDTQRVKVQLNEFYQDFKVALMFYDEGLLYEDMHFANALWYHFFAKECTDPRHIEILIRYIRHQVNFLSHLGTKDIKNYDRSNIIWQPLKPHVKTVELLTTA